MRLCGNFLYRKPKVCIVEESFHKLDFIKFKNTALKKMKKKQKASHILRKKYMTKSVYSEYKENT